MADNRALPVLILGVAVIASLTGGLFMADAADIVAAWLTASVAILISLAILSRIKDDRQYLIRLWLLALGLRALVATAIYYFDIRDNLAPDWFTYDSLGNFLAQIWHGDLAGGAWFTQETARFRSGWGMYYYVAAVYYVIGRNPYALQLLSCVLGAGTSVLMYRITTMIVDSRRVARLAAVLTAIAPSHLIWTSQGLKEPLITFLISVCLFYTMKLSEKMTFANAGLLLLCLFGLYSLRYYVFFVVFVAIAGALLFARKQFSTRNILQGSGLILVISLVFSYYGAGQVAQSSLDVNRLQSNRVWSAQVSESGYGGNVDISDTRQAIAYLPIGVVFFLFAPFPWMIRNFNHVVLLPELIVWWMAAPLLFYGFWLTLRYRLKVSLPLCLFTAGLTMSYGLYLTNFGTAHRMRCQLLGFLIIFTSIGWETWRARYRQRHPKGRAIVRNRNWAPARTVNGQENYVRNRWHSS